MGRSFQSCESFFQYLGSPIALGPVNASWESLTKQAIHPMTEKQEEKEINVPQSPSRANDLVLRPHLIRIHQLPVVPSLGARL